MASLDRCILRAIRAESRNILLAAGRWFVNFHNRKSVISPRFAQNEGVVGRFVGLAEIRKIGRFEFNF